jgi:hypothetical protein
VDDRQRQSFNVISDEPDNAKAAHSAHELNLFLLLSDVVGVCLGHEFLRVKVDTRPYTLALRQLLTLLYKFDELSIAVVNQFHQRVVGCLTCSPVVQQDFKEVAH